MPEFIDLGGSVMNGILVLCQSENWTGKGKKWVCLCNCGAIVEIRGDDLRKGQKYCRNCAPKGSPTHNLSHLPEFGVWGAMKQRCDNPNCDAYENYGARGISYCSEWKKFENFYADMGCRPNSNFTLERIDNEGNYCKENCRWDTRKAQARNFRSNVYLEYNGEKRCISEWGEIYGLKHDTISGRIKRGWSIERAITTPASQKHNHSKRQHHSKYGL